ncbi:MAG: methylamine utilization protein [Nitrospinae bacterium]|nr:methylamine utilization protein [Nitrospinota bacterium]
MASGVLLFFTLIFFGPPANAGEIAVKVFDAKNNPLRGSVIYATPAGGKTPAVEKGKMAMMDQINKEFIPIIMAVQTGTAVSFPNKDNIRHHVYSISPAKKFELPLYIGSPDNSMVFDKPGIVALGCNIHDWMLAYIIVVDTPYFAVTGEDGRGKIKDIPNGNYKLAAWHYRMKGDPEAMAVDAQVSQDGAEKTFALNLKPEFKIQRAPSISGRSYR